jgi:hypothetical protein
MDPQYHEALIASSVERLRARIAEDGWDGVSVERDGDRVYVGLSGKTVGDRYLTVVDMSGFPIEPYDIGFIRPDSLPSERHWITSRDPRFWPWSPMPGLHGSFNLFFQGAFRVFWCREWTVGYFYYHGQEKRWEPAIWPLDKVVEELRRDVAKAEHPRHWRAVQRPVLLHQAAGLNLTLPAGAGIDNG